MDGILSVQGIGYLTRAGIGLATITIDVKVYEAPPTPPNTSTEPVTHIDIVQSASGLSTSRENRCLDYTFRGHSDFLFGDIRGRSTWVSLDEVDDEFLREGWEVTEGKTFVKSQAENVGKGWVATQIWGFQVINGERRYCRNIVVTKGKERATTRLVYDFEG